MKIYEGKIYFEVREKPRKVIQINYNGSFYAGQKVEKDNKFFFARLEFSGMSRGRSAANFDGILREVECTDKEYESLLEGAEVTLFMVDVLHIIQNSNIYGGKVRGLWSFCKRGSNYGLKFESPV